MVPLLGCLAAFAFLHPSPAVADDPPPNAETMARLAAPGGPPAWGALLDWSADSAAGYAERLGHAPAVLAHSTPMPLGELEKAYLRAFFNQTAEQGAVALLSVYPRDRVGTITPSAVDDLAGFLAEEGTRVGVPVLLAIAPEMNGSWRSWGQDAPAYREFFRAVAGVVRAAAPGVQTLWEPAQGDNYPFGSTTSANLEPNALTSMDTNGNGILDTGDDPYLPYYPGDDVVDWVGLSVSFGNPDDQASSNVAAPPGELMANLTGAGSPSAAADFYGRFPEARNKPLVLDTAARYVQGLPGDSEVAVKRAWWEQGISPGTTAALPSLRVVVWRELTTGIDGRVDLRVTHTEPLRTALRADLASASVLLGPVTTSGTSPSQAKVGGPVLSGVTGWMVSGLVLLGGIILLVLGFSPRAVSWHYPEALPRDLRVDLLRGVAIVFVVVNHIDIPSLYQLVSQEALGAISGAELFVLLSGVVLGMVYRPRMERDGFGDTAIRLVKRAWKLYYTALFVVLSVYLISRIPGVDAAAVTTFTDQGTGAAGGRAAGQVYQLYGSMDQLFSYPVPPSVFADVLLLRIGPWQFNVIGLYVILLLIAPVVLWTLRRHLAVLALAVSWALYLGSALHPLRIFPSQFEDSFPLLSWQILFVHGIVAGYYRGQILAFFRRRPGRVVLITVVLAYLGFLFFTWNNPYQANAYDPRLGLIDDDDFRSIYQSYFTRTYLGIGRLLNVFAAVITLYALLTAFWKPIDAAMGRFLIPLGQASLYVFIMHVYFAVLIANIPALQKGSILLNTAAYTLVLAALWVMVRRRFMFRWVPR
jgi:hypothetical protein